MDERRLSGERIAALVRIAACLLVAALFLTYAVGIQPFGESVLGALFLVCLGITVLYSLFVLRLLKKKGYWRAMFFVSSGLDVSMISFTVLVILRYSGDTIVALAAFFTVYLLYFPVIALSVRRFDPAGALFSGLLAAAQYISLAVILSRSPLLFPKHVAVASVWFGDLAPNELFKGVLLLVAGIIGFSVARNGAQRLLQVAGTEGALHVEQATLTRFFESTPEAIVVTDNDTRILRVNSAFSELFGYSEKEAIGRQIDELISPEELADEAARLSHEASSGKKFFLETKRRRKDKTLVDVSILGAPIVYRGEQIAVFGTYRNISEQKRKDRLLQALNQAALAMHEALTHEQIVDAVSRELERLGFMWTVLLLDESGTRLQVEYLGFESSLLRTTERLLGVSEKELRILVDGEQSIQSVVRKRQTRFIEDPTFLLDFIFPRSLASLSSRLAKILRLTKSIGAPLVQGVRVIGMLTVHSAVLSPEDVGAITAFANQLSASWQKISLIEELETSIAELKKTQAQLLQAQKMEAVGRLAGGIAHDFNNLLTVIRGYSELLLADFDSNSTVAETIEEIKKAGEQASQLTEHLLAFSRKQITQPTIVNLNDTIRGMEKILQRLIGEDISLSTLLEQNLKSVRIDPAQIQQVIMNLAVNARDAMPDGGRLEIETANTLLDSSFVSRHPEVNPGWYVCLSITDTGRGIPEGVIPQIFEPFFTTKERGRGTGLGLSTVYGIVKQSAGYVYAKNVSGGGARFTLFFPPREEEAILPDSGSESLQVQNNPEKILLVEDEATVRRLTQTMLERQGYTVIIAGNAEEALSLGKEELETVRVLITDVVMPGMNGRVLARKIRDQFPEMKVLFLSGYAEQMDDFNTVSDPNSDFLQKPFSRAELLKKIHDIQNI